MNKLKFLSFILISILLFTHCNNKINVTDGVTPLNSKETINKPYVILISLDGYRWDYTKRFNPPNISKLIAEGAQAESIIPCFPSKTFPNHYSIATGMYPNNHGLLDNSYFNLNKNATYKTKDREIVEDGSWYGGTPIWVHAAQSGMVTASFFFVGSEADIKGIRPTYYFKYDGSIKNEDRVQQALDWLTMPDGERPHLITMYFSDMDDIGHRVGPNNDDRLREAILELDEDLGILFNGVKNTGLPVNIIIVSDHGMLEIPTDQYIALESIENDEHYLAVSNGAIVHIYPKNENDIEKIFLELKSKENHFTVYKTEDTPQFEINPTNKNWGGILVVPDKGWYFTSQRNIGFKKTKNIEFSGEHGFDPEFKELQGIFYANGPSIKNGIEIPSVKNIHVYPLICEILGLKIPKEIDGKLEVLESILDK
ncbi:MAG: ectonucleotide pyrophosphatase/phosphodiesterase [Saprospiraceae bacterium]